MSGFDDQNSSYSVIESTSPNLSNTVSNSTLKDDYKHVSFINVLPDLEDFEYQRLVRNNRPHNFYNEVLHQPLIKQSVKNSSSRSSFSPNSSNLMSLSKNNSHVSDIFSLTSFFNKPNEFNKIIEEQDRIAIENANFNAGRRASNQTLSKFSNLMEVEDVKFSNDNDRSLRNTSKIGSITKGKNIAEMSLEEIQHLEDQLATSRKISRNYSSQNYDFNMVQDSSRGVWEKNFKSSSSAGRVGTMSQNDIDVLEQNEKLLLQNGYPTRPWIKNNACILNFKHSKKVERTVFVYISGREHTWTSLEYYFKYIQRDNDHLVLGAWIPRKNIIQPELEKSNFSELIHFTKPIHHYKTMENKVLSSCHDLLNYAIYKNSLKKNKPIQITCSLQTNDDPQEVFLDIINEFEPILTIITSVTYNHFIKFQNQTIKLAHFFTKLLSTCIVINQDFFNMPLHQFEKVKEMKLNTENSIDIVDRVCELTAIFPFENITPDDMTSLHKYEPSETNYAFKKYHYNFPQVPTKVNTKMKISTPEGFFIRNGYMKPELKRLEFLDYDPNKEDSTVNLFYSYTNTRRNLESVKALYALAIEKFKPSDFYLDRSNEHSMFAKSVNNDYRKQSFDFDSNNAALLMLKKVVSSNNIKTGSGGSNSGSRRSSMNSMDDSGFRKLTSNDSSEQSKQNYNNYFNKDYYLEKEKEEKKKMQEKQDKIKKEMEKEMISNCSTKLVKQRQDVMKKFKEERKQLNKIKSESESANGKLKTLASNSKIDTAVSENKKKKSWKLW
ncbi:hypothetical protein QEN19_002488 [Hanseniaspora menglaensis]